jgi:hypothetical protein
MIWLANKQARALDAIKVAVWILAGLAILGVLYGSRPLSSRLEPGLDVWLSPGSEPNGRLSSSPRLVAALGVNALAVHGERVGGEAGVLVRLERGELVGRVTAPRLRQPARRAGVPLLLGEGDGAAVSSSGTGVHPASE